MKEFDNYIKQFNLSNYDINYKYEHSYRVMEISEKLAKSLNLSKHDINLSKIIGLLHDIGRFSQLKEYSSYNDNNIDHADMGVNILFKNKLISNFKIDKKDYRKVKIAIKYHNKYKIPSLITKSERIFINIIRDADKIDILNAYTILNSYNITEDLDNVSPKVEKQYFNNNPIDSKYRKTKGDKLIQALAFVYDINYIESLKIIKDKQFYQKLYSQIKDKKKYKKYFEELNKYIEKRIKDVR